MKLLNEAKNADYVFISVMGPHAQEKENDIFARKTEDINKVGESFWVSRIDEKFVEECRGRLKGDVGYLLLVNSSADGNGASDTKIVEKATHFSKDKEKWSEIDAGISQVTGNLGKGVTAYYFDDIVECDEPIDLDYYSEVDEDSKAIKFRQGYSNVFAKKNVIKLEGGMKSSKRKIVAVLRLKYPYIVWVK